MEHEAHVCVESRMHVSSFDVHEPSAGVGWALGVLSGLSVYALSVHLS
jgi:hypothetical protein